MAIAPERQISAFLFKRIPEVPNVSLALFHHATRDINNMRSRRRESEREDLPE
jgi:hypothetical protein